MSSLLSKRLWLLWVLFGSALMVGREMFAHRTLVLDVAAELIELVSVAALIVGVRRNRPSRPVIWYLFAIGLFLYVSADTTYTVVDSGLHWHVPFPSPIDGIYLAEYPVLA